MATVTRYHNVKLPNGQVQQVPYQVDEAEEAARGLDPDYGKPAAEVIQECATACDDVNPGRHETAALLAIVRRLVKLVARGIGTSPSDPPPAQ